MFKAITAVVFAVVIIGISLGASRPTAMTEAIGPQRSLKSDRLVLRPNEPACTEAGWPNYDSRCVRNSSQPGAQRREIRVVSSDRLPPRQPAAPPAN